MRIVLISAFLVFWGIASNLSYANTVNDNLLFKKHEAKIALRKLERRIKTHYAGTNMYAGENKYLRVLDFLKIQKRQVSINHYIPLKPAIILKDTEHYLSEKGILLVVHAYTDFDMYLNSFNGINAVIKEAVQNVNLSIVYILADANDPDVMFDNRNSTYRTGQITWFASFRYPNIAVVSPLGRHSLFSRSNEVTFAGGFWEGCLSRAINSFVFNRELLVGKDPTINRNLIINIIGNAIYDDIFSNLSEGWKNQAEQFLDKYWASSNSLSMKNLFREYNYSVIIKDKVIFTNVGTKKQHLKFVFRL